MAIINSLIAPFFATLANFSGQNIKLVIFHETMQKLLLLVISPAPFHLKPKIITTLIINFPPKSIIIFNPRRATKTANLPQENSCFARFRSGLWNIFPPLVFCRWKLKRKTCQTFLRFSSTLHRESKTTNDKIKKIDCCSRKTKEKQERNFPHIFFCFHSVRMFLCNKQIRILELFLLIGNRMENFSKKEKLTNSAEIASTVENRFSSRLLIQ